MPLGKPPHFSNRCLSRQKSRFSTSLATRLFQRCSYQSVIGLPLQSTDKLMPKTKKTHDLKALLANSFLPTLKLSTQFTLCFALVFIILLSTASLSYANNSLKSVSTADISTSTENKAEAKTDKNKTKNAVAEVTNANNSLTKKEWHAVEQLAKNHAVYFHAWGGDPQINSYIQWLAKRVKQEYDIQLQHVKLTDTSEAVSRVLAEKSADNHQQGQVDLVWINGENFASMAKYQLLAQGWVAQLPNFSLTNPSENEAMTRDFGLPTQGMEAPWGQASLTFYYTPIIARNQSSTTDKSSNAENLATPAVSYQNSIRHAPKNIKQLLTWAKKNPGRFTYPKPPDFLSLSFLKYALITLNQDQSEQVKSTLYQAVTPQSQDNLLPALWSFLDELHPNLWHQGQYFAASGTALQRLVGDGEINLGFTFAAAQIPASVDRYNLPENTRSFVMEDGSLSNIHFVAIPYNAANHNAAKVVANFMLSVEAQAKKQQATMWGDSTVLDVSQLSQQQQLLFSTDQQHPSALPVNSKIIALSEPHPSWSKLISREWLKRYGAQ
jgi:putative thiamine transport system substrate-binding protein